MSDEGWRARLERMPAITHGGGARDQTRLHRAGSALQRGRGLAGLRGLPPDVGLLLPRCRSVHTFGVRFALDLLWLDAAGTILRVDRRVPPRRLRTCWRARALVEVRAGSSERFSVALSSGALTELRSAITS